MTLNISETQKTKVKSIINAGIDTLGEIEVLKGSLKDAVKNLAEELQIKPAEINEAIKLGYKQQKEDAVTARDEKQSNVDTLLHAAGIL
jgi:hypothetical protein